MPLRRPTNLLCAVSELYALRQVYVSDMKQGARLATGLLALSGSAYCDVPAVKCPSSCEDLFGRLKNGVQQVEVQLRGGATSNTTRVAEFQDFTCHSRIPSFFFVCCWIWW